MVTVYEIRHTSPREWLAEAQADIERHAIQDSIIRLAVRKGPARVCDVYPDRGFDERHTKYRALYVEATYLNHAGQLVKLSSYCGVCWPDFDVLNPTTPLNDEGRSPASHKRVQEVMRQIQVGVAELENADIRGGVLTVEEGAWQAGVESTIDAPPELACATCDAPIYWSNGEWRHKAGRREEYVGVDGQTAIIIRDKIAAAWAEVPCPDCKGEPRKPDPRRKGATINCTKCATSPGVRRVEHHIADPEQKGRKE